MENKIFQNVLLDEDEKLTYEEKRFYSCVRFVADKCTNVKFYINGDWSEEVTLKKIGVSPEKISSTQRDFLKGKGFKFEKYDPSLPRVVGMSVDDWGKRAHEEKDLPVIYPEQNLILSNNEFTNKAVLEDQGLNSNTAILCLASAGLNLMLPNVCFDLIAKEEIEKIRNTLQEERANYLAAMTKVADETFERIGQGDLTDIMRWARNEVNFKIIPKARMLENNINKISKTDLKKSGFSFWKEKVPVIGSAYLTGGILNASKVTAEEILKSIIPIMIKEREERNLPEFAYALRIAEATEI